MDTTGGDISEDEKWLVLKPPLATAVSGVFVQVLAPPVQDLGESGSAIVKYQEQLYVAGDDDLEKNACKHGLCENSRARVKFARRTWQKQQYVPAAHQLLTAGEQLVSSSLSN